MVELMCGFHHVSSGSDQGKIRDGGVSMLASNAPLASASSLIHSSQWRKLHGSL